MKTIFKVIKNEQIRVNVAVVLLLIAIAGVVIWGRTQAASLLHMGVEDGIEQIDLDSIYLKNSGVEVDFTEVILSDHNEMRKLIVSTQTGKVSTELTDRLIRKLDFDFLKKTQTISYTGTGYFVVDLDKLTAANIIEDKAKKTVTIKIGHAYLQAIDIDPNNIIIDEVKEGLLARGNIKLTVDDYNNIEKDLRTRMEDKFDTVANGQAADNAALKMVKEIYEPIIKAIDRRYDVIIEFK